MKIINAIAVCTALFSCSLALATGGRLNSAGCHNSKKAGYHCHRAQKEKSSEISKTNKAPSRHKNQPKP